MMFVLKMLLVVSGLVVSLSLRINMGRFMGWGGLRGQQQPLFSEVFLKNSQYNKKYLYSWQVSRSPLSEFS